MSNCTVDEKMEEDDLDAADSGMGASLRPSSGRISALSHLSDGTLIQIPDGRYIHCMCVLYGRSILHSGIY